MHYYNTDNHYYHTLLIATLTLIIIKQTKDKDNAWSSDIIEELYNDRGLLAKLQGH